MQIIYIGRKYMRLERDSHERIIIWKGTAF